MRFSIWRITLKVIFVVFMLLIMIGPLVGIVIWSFARVWYWPSPIPQEFTLRYWLEVFRQGRVLNSLMLSVTIALLTVVFSITLAIPAAYGFARYKLPFERVLLLLFLMPQTFPQLPVFINLASIFGRMGLRGNIWGIILAHTMASLVFSLWIITATFKSIPVELEHVAQNLGASRFKTFWTVTFPLAIPGIIAGAIYVFLWSMGEFTAAFFIGAPFIQTAPVLMYTSSMGYNLQIASVIAIILVIPSLIFMVLIERFLKAEYIAGLGG
ncbi:MAG TPA: ABC transporter permease [Pseudothermotoga sp.]|nr:ABC transporter permease [Pseudothermotoga sp.]HOK84515.1 ABC transporter permease [Pseudothermotoga sp.]HPP69396.1 ABC transporter permease [Pseudothermotoga sp.]